MTRLKIVWNRDKARYGLSVQGFTITRSSELQCLFVARDAFKRAYDETDAKINKLLTTGGGATKGE